MTAATLLTPFGVPFDTAVIVGVVFVLLAVLLSRLGTPDARDNTEERS